MPTSKSVAVEDAIEALKAKGFRVVRKRDPVKWAEYMRDYNAAQKLNMTVAEYRASKVSP